MGVGVEDVGRVAAEGRPAGEELVGEHAEGVDIGCRAVRPAESAPPAGVPGPAPSPGRAGRRTRPRRGPRRCSGDGGRPWRDPRRESGAARARSPPDAAATPSAPPRGRAAYRVPGTPW